MALVPQTATLGWMPHLALVPAIEHEQRVAESRFSARQQEVLDVVEAVFLRDGLAPVRIGRLAAEARCSRRTLYELAAGKEDLFLVVLDRFMRRIARSGRDAIAHERDPVRRIVAMGTAAAEGFGALTPAFIRAVEEYPPARRRFDEHIAAARSTLEALIDDAIEEGSFRPLDASTAAEAVLVLVLHFVDSEHARSTGVSPAAALELVFDVFVAGAEARP